MKKLLTILCIALSLNSSAMEQDMNIPKEKGEEITQKGLSKSFKALSLKDTQQLNSAHTNILAHNDSSFKLLPKDIKHLLKKDIPELYKYQLPALPLLQRIDLKKFNLFQHFKHTFSRDCRYVALTSLNRKNLIIIDLKNGKTISDVSFAINMAPIASFYFIPEQPRLLIFGGRTISIWNFEKNSIEKELSHISGTPVKIACSDDGSFVAIMDQDSQKIQVWDTRTQQLLELHDHAENVTTLEFIPHSHKLISGDGNHLVIKNLDDNTTSTIAHHSRKQKLIISPDGRICALHALNIGTIFYDLNTLEMISQSDLQPFSAWLFVQDGSMLVIFDGNYRLAIFDVHEGKGKYTISIPEAWNFEIKDTISNFLVDEAKKTILVCSLFNLIHVYDLETGAYLTTIKPTLKNWHTSGIQAAKLNENASHLIVANNQELQRINLQPSLNAVERLQHNSEQPDELVHDPNEIALTHGAALQAPGLSRNPHLASIITDEASYQLSLIGNRHPVLSAAAIATAVLGIEFGVYKYLQK